MKAEVDATTPRARELILQALQEIARGRTDCGRPLGGEAARQKARRALLNCGLSWAADKGGSNG